MKKRNVFLILLCVLVLIAGLAFKLYTDRYIFVAGKSVPLTAESVDLRDANVSISAYHKLQSKLPSCDIRWTIPFQGNLYDSATQEIEVTTLSEEDVAVLELFPDLTYLEAVNCSDYDALLKFNTRRPSCEVDYRYTLGGTVYESTTREIVVTDPDFQELKTGLPHFQKLKKLHLTGKLPEYAQLEELVHLYPQVEIRWDIPLDERTLSSKLTYLNLSGIPVSYDDVVELLQWLPNTQTVDMRGCGLTDKEMMRLADTYSHISFIWEMAFGELLLPTNAEEIDISGQVLQSTSEIEDILPYFPKAKKVVMSHCGFDDETMDALDKRYDDIRFVWSVKIKDRYLRTDATFFYPFKFYRTMTVNNNDLYPLRYCTDIVAIDIGHMWAVTDCEWAAFMPNLKYLILAETQITDLTPLTKCKNLAYLEIFKTQIRDYSPLLECPSLVDINLSRTYGDYRPIAQMTWLKNVWWNGIAGTKGFPCSGAEHVLPKALPDAKLVFNQANTVYYTGWRDLDSYKAMRDVMGMFYLR